MDEAWSHQLAPYRPSLLFYAPLDGGLTPSTFGMYTAAISAMHTKVGGMTMGSHMLVERFLKDALRLTPPRRNPTPPQDLPLTLVALRKGTSGPSRWLH